MRCVGVGLRASKAMAFLEFEEHGNAMKSMKIQNDATVSSNPKTLFVQIPVVKPGLTQL